MESTLFTCGILLLLVGLIGQVKAKEIEVGTKNPIVRIILGVIGVLFVYLALSKDYLPILASPTQTSPISAPASTLVIPVSGSGPTSGSPISSEDSNVPEPSSSTGCMVTISNPLVPLMSQPDAFSQELARVNPGEYPVLKYTETTFVNQRQGSFQIDAAGRTGWIRNDIWTIADKSSACP